MDIHLRGLSTYSKHKDEAMEVIRLITSKELQMKLSRYGTTSVLTDPEIRKSFASEVPELKGNHVEAPFKAQPRVPRAVTKYDSSVRALDDQARKDLATGGQDVNTLICGQQEKATE